MTDKQQIEEIMKVLNECCGVYDENGRHLRNKCNKYECEYWSDENYCCCSYGRREAEALYNAGYRKVGEAEMVVTKDEWEELQGEVVKQAGKKWVLQFILKEERKQRLKELIASNKVIKAETRKETAKEILQYLYCFVDGHSFYLDETINRVEYNKVDDILAFIGEQSRKYGVEVYQ